MAVFSGLQSLHSAGKELTPGIRYYQWVRREFHTSSADETMAIGYELAPVLRDARIVLLEGVLGAGKTTLVKGIAEAFSAAERDDVTSPTFTLVHEYRGPERSLFHIDLYRLETERELATLGLDDLMDEPGNILLIEWGEKFDRLVRLADVHIAITRRGEDERAIAVSSKENTSPGR